MRILNDLVYNSQHIGDGYAILCNDMLNGLGCYLVLLFTIIRIIITIIIIIIIISSVVLPNQ